jgi:hypothetical protein
VATGVTIACLVDVGRLVVYWQSFAGAAVATNAVPLITACGAAFFGSFLAARLLAKVTYRIVQYTVAGLMLLIAAGLASGWV